MQGLTGVEGLGDIQTALATRVQAQHLADERTVDTPPDEGLAQEGGARAAFRHHGGLGEFQHNRACVAQGVLGQKQPRIAPVGDEPLQGEAVDIVADGGRRQDGEALRLGRDRLPVGRAGADHVDDDGGGVVARPRRLDLGQDRFGVRVGRTAPSQQARDHRIGQHPMHPVGGQQQTIVRFQPHLPDIQLHIRLDAHRAIQHMAQPLLGARVVFGQPRQNPVAEMPGPAVAHMKRRRLAPAQDQGGKGGRRPLHRRIDPAPRMEPAVEAPQRLDAVGGDAVQRVLIQIAVDEAARRQLRRHPPGLRPRHPVGDHRHHPMLALLGRRADMDAAEILIIRLGPLQGRKAGGDLQSGVGHGRNCRRKTAR